MKKIIAVAVFALVMLGAAGAGTVTMPNNDGQAPPPSCDPTTQKCS